MKILLFCCLITAFVFVILYIWGKSFLTVIEAETYVSDSILFGFVIIHIIFQIFYLPFLLTRGSFYILSTVWVIFASLFTLFQLFYLYKKKELQLNIHFSKKYSIVLLIIVAVIGFMCFYIGGHPRWNGIDTVQYIRQMNEMVYRGTLWNEGNELQIHQGLNSYYTLYAIISWITRIKPIFVNQFIMRFVGVILFSIVSFRFGRIFFDEKGNYYPLIVAIFAPIVMMLWNSQYSAAFFYSRTNESKAICQLVLFPLAVSIYIELLKVKVINERKVFWLKEIAIGLAAVPIAVSSMSIYPVIAFVGMVAILTFDKFKKWHRTLLYSALCVLPNVFYLFLYILYQQKILRF